MSIIILAGFDMASQGIFGVHIFATNVAGISSVGGEMLAFQMVFAIVFVPESFATNFALIGAIRTLGQICYSQLFHAT